MIFNALITTLTTGTNSGGKVRFETGKMSPFRYSSSSKLRRRLQKTNSF